MKRHQCGPDAPCPACERDAENRAEARRDFDVEPLDQWGRDADFNWPRGFGGVA
jgi:hypothetical protein